MDHRSGVGSGDGPGVGDQNIETPAVCLSVSACRPSLQCVYLPSVSVSTCAVMMMIPGRDEDCNYRESRVERRKKAARNK